MLKLKCLGSGSKGNCYLLQSENETLILDCGIAIKDIKKGLNFDISKVVGVLCTHSHKDHSLSLKDFENMGIPCIEPYEKEVAGGMLGSFKVMPFALTNRDGRWMHTNADGSECPCYGFLIAHPQLGKMLYITDTELVKWTFKDINHILISCNYQKKYIDDENLAKRNHVFRGHMELETVKEFIKANNSDSLRSVILCHLSRDNAAPEECVAEVEKVAGNGVYVDCARKGFEVELRNGECPF